MKVLLGDREITYPSDELGELRTAMIAWTAAQRSESELMKTVIYSSGF